MQPGFWFGSAFVSMGGALWWWGRQAYDSATGYPIKERTLGRRQGASIALSIQGFIFMIVNIVAYLNKH
ncbi:hypothetical protein KBB85_02950 [Patescibacteria group bacterium]|nr:hypothetical protein [Patescibacteria group bacterium]